MLASSSSSSTSSLPFHSFACYKNYHMGIEAKKKRYERFGKMENLKILSTSIKTFGTPY